jgi:hypothetical protein
MQLVPLQFCAPAGGGLAAIKAEATNAEAAVSRSFLMSAPSNLQLTFAKL